MSQKSLLVATRKGLMLVAHDTIQAHYFEGDAISQVLVDTRNQYWYAAQNLGHFGIKMKRSKDQGSTWDDIAAPALPSKPTDGVWADDTTPWSVEMIWELQQGGNDIAGELWAGCLPGSLFRSTDYGDSWQLVESLWYDARRRDWFGGGYDVSGIHSILVDPHNPSHMTLGVSSGGIWESYDRSNSWTQIGQGQEADFLPPEQRYELGQQDPHRLAHCAKHPDRLWVQHHCGQYVSNDRAKNLIRINRSAPAGTAGNTSDVPVSPNVSDFGFAVACDPINPNRAWFVPAVADAKRYPPSGALCVLRTDDGGQSFVQQRAGLLKERQGRQLVLDKLAGQIRAQRKEIATLKRDEQRLSDLLTQLAKRAAKAKPLPVEVPKTKIARPAEGSKPEGSGKPVGVNQLVPEFRADGTPFSRLKGLLRLPVRGELMNKFGAPREGGGLNWKGLFIRAAQGSEVRAVAQGKVAFSEWLRGFGNLVIVDHGEGYMSLYSNNESLYKQTDEPVKAGEVIASVGNSGGQEDNGVYFELRHKSRPINPMGWVK